MAQYDVTLRDYWRILRRRKGIVLFTAFVLGFFSLVIATIWQPVPMYRASAKIQLNAQQASSNALAQLALASYSESSDVIETQLAIITSFPVMKEAARDLDLFGATQTIEDTAVVVLALQGQISAVQEGYTNIIEIEATDSDPYLARDMANTLAIVYQKYDSDRKNQQAVKHRSFVQIQRDSARPLLEEAEEAVKRYREKTNLISLSSQTGVVLSAITEADRAVQRFDQNLRDIGAMLGEISKNEVLSESALKGASRSLVGEVFMRLNGQLSNLQLQRDGLLVKYTEGHPVVKELQAKIDQLNRHLVTELRQRQEVIQRSLVNERSHLEKLRAEYNELPSKGLVLSRLERAVDMHQEIVTILEEQYQTALIREADRVQDVAILQAAITPSQPINPMPMIRRGVIGIMLGLILGVVFAVVAETLDTSIGTIEDVQEYTGTQVVGLIPYINVEDVRSSLERRGGKVEDERTVQRKAQLVAYFDPQSTLAESYRILRTNIDFVTVEKGAKCLMITSSTNQEGKSTTAANLAMSIAQFGQRVLLVDGDLRRPTLNRLFGLEREPGLTEVIIGNFGWRDVVRTVTDIVTGGMGMKDVFQTQGISNLNIITSGAIPPNSAELLNSEPMAQFLAEAREAYDVVLVDSPPVLQVTDSSILGRRCDGVLVVYKAGDVPRTALKRSTSLLNSMHVDLLGVILNGIRADLSSEFQDLSHSDYYAYGSDTGGPSRSISERISNEVRGWGRKIDAGKKRLFGDTSPTQPTQKQTSQKQTTKARSKPARRHSTRSGRPRSAAARSATTTLTVIIALGLLWQSGVLSRPLGLVPVLSGHQSGPKPVIPPERLELPLPETQVADTQTTPAERPLVASVPSAEPPLPAAQLQSSELLVEPSASLDPVQAPPSVRLPYAIRAASYPTDSKWSAPILKNLRRHGQDAFLSPVVVRGRQLERLLIGSFESWDSAFARARQLQTDGLIEEYAILRLPYGLELGLFPDCGEAARTISNQPQGNRGSYLQSHKGGPCRLLAGAFSTPEEAQGYLDGHRRSGVEVALR